MNEYRSQFRLVIFALFLGVLMVLSQNCSKGFTARESASNESNKEAKPEPTPEPIPGTGFGLTQRQTLPALPFAQQTTSGTATLSIVPAFPNVSFNSPLFLTHAGDGTNRVFVVEQGGQIKVFSNSPTVAATTTFLNISSLLSSGGGEEGLLGLAFDPLYATNGYFYVYYTAPNPLRSVISRYRVSASNPNAADPASRMAILEFNQPFGNHNGGCLAFGPDGFLYIASGDGGSGGDPQNNGQTLTTLLGKILRIDVRGSPYGIPPTNPYANHATYRREIFAYGVRNPWRMSFDRSNGNLWVGDVGQSEFEEINIVSSGENFGWRACEGNEVYNSSNACPSQYVRPIVAYPRSQGQSVTGGYVYRGTANPSLIGRYLYGDFGSGKIWSLNYNGSAVVSNTEIAVFDSGLSSFGEDQAGEVYLTGYFNGGIYKFQEMGTVVTPVVPTKLSQTGLFTNLTSLTPVAGLTTYDVNVPLWSDGASKKRWIGIPGTEQIQFNRDTPWIFPEGTIFVKHFELPTDASTSKRIETRVFYNGSLGWAGYTYRWNAAGTEADLVAEDGLTETISLGATSQNWRYPSRTECMSCHTQVGGRALGVNTHQLNMNFAYPTQPDNQLRSWNHIGLFETNIGDHASLPKYPPWNDLTGPRENLARAYLAVNCAQCHQPNGTTPTNIDFRYTTPLAQTNLVNVAPTEGNLGLSNPSRIRPGDHASSMVWVRMNRTDTSRMPNLGTSKVDSSGLSILQQWINSL